jgi:ribose transport system ATP-binding protein
MEAKPQLLMSGIAKSYPGVQALDGVSFEVRAGEIHALVGENGAGKSTLIKVLGGAVVADAGDVTLDGERLPQGDPLLARRRGVNIIYQEFTLVPELTVAENIFLGREVTRGPFLNQGAMEKEARALLDRLGAPISPGAVVSTLSVAHQQLVEIARALATQSKMLVLDEPTATLSLQETKRLFEVLRDLKGQGLGVIYISHRLEEIFEVADRVTVLRDGKTVATSDIRNVDRAQLIKWMVGRDLSEEFPARQPEPGPVVFEVRNLACPPFLAQASFQLRKGEIVGLAGLVGAGRTSLGLALFGAMRTAVRGEILLNEKPARFASPAKALEAGVAYLTEDRKARGILPWMGCDQNMTIAHLQEFASGGFISKDRERRTAAKSAESFQLRSAGLDQPAGTLSGGNQQKLLLARYLMKPLRVLILDEPTRGIDVGAKAEIYRLMNQLTEQGLAILMISSELPEILGMSDRIVVMHEGVTRGELSRAEATAERVMELATGGK